MPDLLLPKWEAPLTAEEEAELVLRMRAGDIRARDQLVESQLPWLMVISKKYTCHHMPLPDLFQHAVLELLNCLETFDPSIARLSTYISRPLAWRLSRLVKCSRLIHRPYIVQPKYRQQHAEARQVNAFAEGGDRLLTDGRRPPDEILAEIEEQEHVRGRLHDAIARIEDPRRQRVIRCRLAGQTLSQIGLTEGITREAVRQHERKGLALLRDYLGAA